MDLIDRVRGIANRIPKLEGRLETEEATKMALIVPFLAALGWDVYDPFEVVPEFTSDVGIKKGEKVDYAILKDGHAIMIIEAKKAGVNLDVEPASQLYRYFGVTKARVGILTDGVIYKFFSDLEEPNKMDQRAFFEFDMRECLSPPSTPTPIPARITGDTPGNGLITMSHGPRQRRRGTPSSLVSHRPPTTPS